MIVGTGGYKFDFQDALSAFIFDETDKTKATFHGAPMKAIDIMVELEHNYLFVEVKHYDNIAEFKIDSHDDAETGKRKTDYHKWLKNYLKYKFRDTYLYRYAEDKADKPVHYLCLINFDSALNVALNKNLKRELPVGKASARWHKKLCESCQVLNQAEWNKAFPKWPVKRIVNGVK